MAYVFSPTHMRILEGLPVPGGCYSEVCTIVLVPAGLSAGIRFREYGH